MDRVRNSKGAQSSGVSAAVSARIGFLCVLIGLLGPAIHAAPKAASYAAPKSAPGKPLSPSASARPASPPASTAATPSRPTAPARPVASATPFKTLLDTALVRRLYLDGEFDQAIDKLETSLRYGKGHSHEDSVFAFKHLGVMHAAKYDTREKGKRYMYQLLAVEPTARILDMYASDMIYMIFKNIKDEFDAGRGQYDRGNDIVSGGARPDSAAQGAGSPQDRKGRQGGSGKYWAGAAGIAVVAAGAFAWYHLSDESETKKRNRDIE